jgi:hypothetical protein
MKMKLSFVYFDNQFYVWYGCNLQPAFHQLLSMIACRLQVSHFHAKVLVFSLDKRSESFPAPRCVTRCARCTFFRLTYVPVRTGSIFLTGRKPNSHWVG